LTLYVRNYKWKGWKIYFKIRSRRTNS